MESDPSFIRYRKLRQRSYERLTLLRNEVDEWIARYASEVPSLSEVARLEALSAERSRLLAEFVEAEQQFIDNAIRRSVGKSMQTSE